MSSCLSLMKVVLLTLIAWISLTDMKHNYKIIYERGDLENWNREYASGGYFRMFKYNRTAFCINASFTLLKDMSNDIRFIAQAYKYLSNEYRPDPFRVSGNICKLWKTHTFGISDIQQHGNMRGCNITKGFYYLYNYIPDENKLPPFLVYGRYKLRIEVITGDVQLFVLNLYEEIKPVYPWE